MDLRWLEDVLVLLDEGNLSRAARRRAVTQPAFSRRIRAFEHWLGQDILERGSNRIRIRDALRENEAEIRALFQRLGELQQRVRAAGSAGRTLSLTTQHALAVSLMSDLLVLFRRELGAVSFRLRTTDRSECISTFVRGDADLMVCYMSADEPNLMFDDSFARVSLGTDALVPVAGAGRARETASDQLPVIAYPAQSYLGQVLARAREAGQVRIPRTHPVCDTEFSMAAREMAIRGLGLAWLPASLVGDDIRSGALDDLGPQLGTAGLEIALFARPEAALDPASLAAIADSLRRLAELRPPA